MRPVSRVAIDRVRRAARWRLRGVADSTAVTAAAFGWGVPNLVVGGGVSVLPRSILPFVPEQSITHFGAHVVSRTSGRVP